MIYFIVAALSYSVIAALPFVVSKNIQLMLAVLFGALANICWALITRSIDQSLIPIYSLYYDIMLTLIFLVVPFAFIEFTFSASQIIGALLIVIGIVLIK